MCLWTAEEASPQTVKETKQLQNQSTEDLTEQPDLHASVIHF